MDQSGPLKIIGSLEILIGSSALAVNFGSLLLHTNTKPLGVLIFVIVAAGVSTGLGIGILRHHPLAYQLLLYFSTVIVLSKILIFMDVIQLNGALENYVPGPVKNLTSIFYHAFIIVILLQDNVKERFRL